jgi:hypothetical protein
MKEGATPMLRYKLLILSTLVVISSALASVELFSFHAFAIVDHSRLEWSTGREEQFSLFVIERSSDGQDFFAIGQVAATGSFSEYEFVDTSPLNVNVDHTFYYRLRMVDRDGTFRYSEIQQVSLSFSAVQHTWGSIKAMFR